MRTFALCLVAGALLVAGCGSDDNSTDVGAGFGTQATGAIQQEAGVSASLKSPAQQCKGLSKKRPKGKRKRAKSPYAACVAKAKKKAKKARQRAAAQNGAATTEPPAADGGQPGASEAEAPAGGDGARDGGADDSSGGDGASDDTDAPLEDLDAGDSGADPLGDE